MSFFKKIFSTQLCVVGSYFASWFLFAIIWYLVALQHGDDHDHGGYSDIIVMTDVVGDFDPEMSEDHVVCVDNVVDFTSAFLFSVETQHTIG